MLGQRRVILISLGIKRVFISLILLFCNELRVPAVAEPVKRVHRNSIFGGPYCIPPMESSELDQLNLGSQRNLYIHQPSSLRSPTTYRRDLTLRPTTAAVLANPMEFDGKAIFFTGYLNINGGSEGSLARPSYRIYATKDDYDWRDTPNFLYVHLNDDFRFADEFKDGSRVEVSGYLRARTPVAKALNRFNYFSDADVSGLTYSSLRLTSGDRKPMSSSFRATRPDQREWSIHGESILVESQPRRYIAKGSARVNVEHQESFLTGDEIIYDCLSLSITARGHVKFTRNGKETLSDTLTFEIASDHYLVTEPGIYLDQPVLLSP